MSFNIDNLPITFWLYLFCSCLVLLILLSLFLLFRKTRRKKTRPNYTSEIIYAPLLDQPVIQTSFSFTKEENAQDHFIFRQYPNNKLISYKENDYTVYRHQKIANDKNQYAYTIYFKEYEGTELPYFAELKEHETIDFITLIGGGILFSGISGKSELLHYQDFTYTADSEEVTIIPKNPLLERQTLRGSALDASRYATLCALLEKYAVRKMLTF